LALQNVVGANTTGRIAKALQSSYEAAAGRDWSALLSSGLAAKVAENPDAPTYYNKPLPTPIVAALRPLAAHAKAEMVKRVAQRTTAIHQLLERFDGHYTRLRRARRVMLFDDLSHTLARQLPTMGDALCEHLYYRLDGSIAHLLLDEFQDTSVDQYEVLGRLVREIGAHGDIDRPSDRTVFCVGDIKQSIYGWRGGCPALFDQIERDLGMEPGTGPTLRKSYRSSQVVLDAVNRVFDSLPTQDALADHREPVADWLTGFKDHVAAHQRLPGYVALMTSPASSIATHSPAGSASETDETGHTDHDQFVVNTIKDIVDHALPHGVRDMGVLVRRNATVKRLIHQLRAAGVAASGEGGSPIDDDPAVAVVLSALTLTDHPGHSAAAYHVVNSPLGQVIGLDRVDVPSIERVTLAIRRSLADRGYAATLTDWARALASSCDAGSVARLMQLVERAEAHDALMSTGGTLRTRDFVDAVTATNVEEPSAAPVRVMTIHKAKGLEFDVVVLPELQSLIGRTTDMPAWTFRQHDTEPPTAVFATSPQRVRDLITPLCPQYAQAYEQEQRRRLHDDLSALYVALTRPRFALHMIVEPLKPKKDGSPSVVGLTNLSYASLLHGALCDIKETFEGCQTLHELGDARWYEGHYIDHVHAERDAQGASQLSVKFATTKEDEATRSWRRVAPSSLEYDGRVRAADLLMPSISDARLRGAVLHVWLADIEWLDDQWVWDEARMRTLAKEAAPNLSDNLLEQWQQAFSTMLQLPTLRRFLSRGSDDLPDTDSDLTVWRERSFAVRDGQTLLNGTFDRVVIGHRAGRPAEALLVDFKSDRVDEATRNDALDALVVGYRPQVAAYRRALGAMLGISPERVKAVLLFLNNDEARIVD